MALPAWPGTLMLFHSSDWVQDGVSSMLGSVGTSLLRRSGLMDGCLL